MAELPTVTLVLGGARSGKSRYAEALVLGALGAPVYMATAEAGDAEMAERIARHREQRQGAGWRTVEAPLDLVAALREADGSDGAVLVDCLTLWLANLMETGRDAEAEQRALIECLSDLAGPVVLVSNEVGQGIVPDNALARRFRDSAGALNAAVAEAADQVFYLVAGLAQRLK